MNELELTKEDALAEKSSRYGYLIPKQRREWGALAVTVLTILLVFAWMWGSLVVIAANWTYVLGFVALVGLWVAGKTRRSKKARRHILKELRKAEAPMSTKTLFKRMAMRKVSPETVNITLQELLEEGLVEAELDGIGITYYLLEAA